MVQISLLKFVFKEYIGGEFIVCYIDFRKEVYERHYEIFGDGSWSFGLRDNIKVTKNGIYDPIFVRVKDSFVSYRMPRYVERTAQKILVEYIKSRRKMKKAVMITNFESFVETLIYYAHVVNGLNYNPPSEFHRGLRNFVRAEYGDILKKNLIKIRDSTYQSLIKQIKISKPEDDVGFYMFSNVIDKYFGKKLEVYKDGKLVAEYSFVSNSDLDEIRRTVKEKFGHVKVKKKNIVTRSRSPIVASVTLYLADNLGILRMPYSSSLSLFGVAVNYARKMIEENRGYFEYAFEKMKPIDRATLVKGIVIYLSDKVSIEVNKNKLKEFVGEPDVVEETLNEIKKYAKIL